MLFLTVVSIHLALGVTLAHESEAGTSIVNPLRPLVRICLGPTDYLNGFI